MPRSLEETQGECGANSVSRRRGRLAALWVLTLILALAAVGLLIYQRAKSDVEEYFIATNSLFGQSISKDAFRVTFDRITLSSESWIRFSFRTRIEPKNTRKTPRKEIASRVVIPSGYRFPSVSQMDVDWSLREFAAVPPSPPEPLPDYTFLKSLN